MLTNTPVELQPDDEVGLHFFRSHGDTLMQTKFPCVLSGLALSYRLSTFYWVWKSLPKLFL